MTLFCLMQLWKTWVLRTVPRNPSVSCSSGKRGWCVQYPETHLSHAALENVGGAYSTQKPIRRVVLVIISVTVFTSTHPPELSALLLRLAFQIPRTRLHGLTPLLVPAPFLSSVFLHGMTSPPLRLYPLVEQTTLCKLSLLHNLQQDWRFTNINLEK